MPGVIAARSVKWLTRVEVSEHEGENHHQKNDYRGASPNVNWDTVDWSKAHPIEDMPVTSKICSWRRCPESPDQVVDNHKMSRCCTPEYNSSHSPDKGNKKILKTLMKNRRFWCLATPGREEVGGLSELT